MASDGHAIVGVMEKYFSVTQRRGSLWNVCVKGLSRVRVETSRSTRHSSHEARVSLHVDLGTLCSYRTGVPKNSKPLPATHPTAK